MSQMSPRAQAIAKRRQEREDMERLSSGFERKTIAVFLAESPWGEIGWDSLDKGLGGRETALVCLAMEWARLGHDVYAFVPRSQMDITDHPSGGCVRWIPNDGVVEITEAVQPDYFISWENAEVLDALENYWGVKAIEMQVAHLNTLEPVSSSAHVVCVLSEWAKSFFLKKHPDMPEDRVLVLPNGVYLTRYQDEVAVPFEIRQEWEDSYNFIYSSSPDRGLHHLLNIWPQIMDLVMQETGTEAYLHICYGVEKFVEHSRWSHREDGIRALDIEEGLNLPNIVYHGKIGQEALAALQLNCDAMLYPADTMSPTETGCISIVEALAAGLPVVTTDCDCIGPEFGDVTIQVPLPWKPAQFIEASFDVLNPEDYEARAQVGKKFAKDRHWTLIARSWIEEFAQLQMEVEA